MALVQIGIVCDDGTLVTVWIAPEAVAVARAQGWMVFDDFERQLHFNAPRIVHDEGDR